MYDQTDLSFIYIIIWVGSFEDILYIEKNIIQSISNFNNIKYSKVFLAEISTILNHIKS